MKTAEMTITRPMGQIRYFIASDGERTAIVAEDSIDSWTFEVPMAFEEVIHCFFKYRTGSLLQDAFPTLPPSLRECMITNPMIWEEMKNVK